MITKDAQATMLFLEKDEAEKITEFEGQNVDILNPAFVLIKSEKENSFQAIPQLMTTIGTFPAPALMINIETGENIVEVMKRILQAGFFRWNDAIEAYEKRFKRINKRRSKKMAINYEDRYIVNDIFYIYDSEVLHDTDDEPYITFFASNGEFVKRCKLKNGCAFDKPLPLNSMARIEGAFEGTNLIVEKCTAVDLLDIPLEKFFGGNIPADIKIRYVLDFLASLKTEAAELMYIILDDYQDALKLTYVPLKSEYEITSRKDIIDGIYEQVSHWVYELDGHMDIGKIDVFFAALIALKLADFFMLYGNPVAWQSARFEKMKAEVDYFGKESDISKQVTDDIKYLMDFCQNLSNEEIEKKLFNSGELKSNSDA